MIEKEIGKWTKVKKDVKTVVVKEGRLYLRLRLTVRKEKGFVSIINKELGLGKL